ncbi:MAG: hypothetical protein ACJA1U_000142 [Bermanella sp.]|jgi:hypothetical protein
MNIKDLHHKLKTYLDWPIPYWVSPVGVFLISALFWLYSKAYDFNMPSTTHWILDKIVYILGIFAAALIAQHIFNQNARNRENRERRLRRIEEVIPLVESLREAAIKYNSATSETYEECYTAIMNKLVVIKTYLNIYFPDKTNINDFHKYMTENNRAIRRDFMKDDRVKKVGVFIKSRDKEASVAKNINKLVKELIDIHQLIERE